MNNAIMIITSAIIAYLLGSIQTSILISRGMHDDIRTHGSGNAGSTNMVRVYGIKVGLATFVCDFGKAFLTVAMAKWLLPAIFKIESEAVIESNVYITALMTVLGHNFPVFFGFRGGKGVATSFGMVFAVFGMCMGDWIIPILTAVLGVGMVVVTGIVSVGSLTGAIVQLISALVIYSKQRNAGACVIAFVLFSLLFLRHGKNIMRILRGEEKKLNFKKSEKQTDNKSNK